MKLNHEEVRRIAKLARLSLTADEVIKFSNQLSDILSHAKMLEEVDTQGIEPVAQITGIENTLFKDEVIPSSFAEALIHQSPQPIEDGLIKVKSVF